jgi:hypothetical protein
LKENQLISLSGSILQKKMSEGKETALIKGGLHRWIIQTKKSPCKCSPRFFLLALNAS